MAFLDLLIVFSCFSSIFSVRQTKLASSLVNRWAHNKIVFDDDDDDDDVYILQCPPIYHVLSLIHI